MGGGGVTGWGLNMMVGLQVCVSKHFWIIVIFLTFCKSEILWSDSAWAHSFRSLGGVCRQQMKRQKGGADWMDEVGRVGGVGGWWRIIKSEWGERGGGGGGELQKDVEGKRQGEGEEDKLIHAIPGSPETRRLMRMPMLLKRLRRLAVAVDQQQDSATLSFTFASDCTESMIQNKGCVQNHPPVPSSLLPV